MSVIRGNLEGGITKCTQHYVNYASPPGLPRHNWQPGPRGGGKGGYSQAASGGDPRGTPPATYPICPTCPSERRQVQRLDKLSFHVAQDLGSRPLDRSNLTVKVTLFNRAKFLLTEINRCNVHLQYLKWYREMNLISIELILVLVLPVSWGSWA